MGALGRVTARLQHNATTSGQEGLVRTCDIGGRRLETVFGIDGGAGQQLDQALESAARLADLAALERFQGGAALGPRPMRREQQIQIRVSLGVLDRCDGGDELVPLPRDGLDVAAQVAGIEAPAEVTNQFLQAVVPDGRVSPPGADQIIFREDDVRAPNASDGADGRGQLAGALTRTSQDVPPMPATSLR